MSIIADAIAKCNERLHGDNEYRVSSLHLGRCKVCKRKCHDVGECKFEWRGARPEWSRKAGRFDTEPLTAADIAKAAERIANCRGESYWITGNAENITCADYKCANCGHLDFDLRTYCDGCGYRMGGVMIPDSRKENGGDR